MKKHFTGQSDINHLNAPGLKVRFTERKNPFNTAFLGTLLLLFAGLFFSTTAYSQVTIFSENVGVPSKNTDVDKYTGWENGSPIVFDGTASARNTGSSSGYPGASGDGNVFFTNSIGRYLEISGIDASGYTDLSLSLGHWKNTIASSNELEIEVSADGVNYASLSYSRATGTGTNNWVLITPTGTIPSASNLRIRFTNTSASPQFRIDDILLTGTPAGNNPYLVVGKISNEFGGICLGEIAGPETFTVEGDNLDGNDITVGPLTGFEFSLDDITYSSTVDITYTAPTLASTTVYVKFSPTIEQNYADDIPVTGGDADPEACTLTDAVGVDSAPSVTTGNASNIGLEDATCAGTIDDEGCDVVTAYGIEYSTTEDFTPGTGTQVAGSNLNDGDYDVELTGLDEGTTYYYRAYATSSKGTSYGDQDSFKTDEDDGSLPAPVATEASDVTQTSFQANWNAVSGATCYYLDVYTKASESDNVAFWDFEDGTQQAAGGENDNDLVDINGVGTVGTYTYPQGTGGSGTSAISTTGWDNGADSKYWEIIINTEGYFDLTLSSVQRSSGSGPRDFKVQYMVNGSDWTDVPNSEITVANNYTTGVLNDLRLPEECSDQGELHIRWIMTSNTSVNNGTIANNGTSRQDDIIVKGFLADFELQDEQVCATDYEATNLDPYATYYYRVRATDGTETSGYSNEVIVEMPLPLTMLNFEVTRNSTARTAILKWSTAEEVNSSHFDVLKSTDGFRWEKIGEVKTNGNLRSINSYSFVDSNPARMNYYRLNSVDYDGYSALSEIRSAAFDGSQSTTFYPNPASSYLMVNTESSYNKYSIINALGVTETSGVLNGTETRVDISQLASGIYFLKINNEVQRFVKN